MLSKFSTLFGLHLAYFLFAPLEHLSTGLQSASLSVQGAIQEMSNVDYYFEQQLSEDHFEQFFESVVKCSESVEEVGEPLVPRRIRAPVRYRAGEEEVQAPQAVSKYFQAQYDNVLSTAISSMKKRFKQPSIAMVESTINR